MTSGRELPSGTVTFLFSDIEGSTRLLREIGSECYAMRLREHRELIREVIKAHRGVEFGTEGDAFFIAFARVSDALAAAEAIQAQLADTSISVRIGVHTGEPLVSDGDYVGLDVHKAARICSAANGGQALVSKATHDLAAVELRYLGEHRLKDLAAPEPLFQLGAGDFPPPRTLKRTNLPVQPGPLFGRERELGELSTLVRNNRLVTLTGPGGSGKTRLALALAAELADSYEDGVRWVPLAGVSDPALVLPTIAHAVGASDNLADQLAGKRLLMLLDNLEQVIDAAPLISELLLAAGQLSVIVTSRERLAVSDEQEYPVPPLAEAAATELFIARARQVKPDFMPDEAVLAICRRLDRLPLAIELASTRIKLMTPDQMLARLERRLDLLTGGARDLPARQSTMRATIDWSYDLLSEAERRAFRRLGVFAGSYELEAAEAVCCAHLDELQSLADKSLLRQAEEGRFFLLETTREYALEQLVEAGETDELRRRHADWFLQLARTARDGLRTAGQGLWLARLRAETDNLRAVLAWALEHDIARGVELVEILSSPWGMIGQLAELVDWFERALPWLEALDLERYADALAVYGRALFFSGEHARAGTVLKDSLALFQQREDRSGEARVMNMLASVSWVQGDLAQARALLEQALAIFRRAGDREGTARSLHLLGEELRDRGEFDRAAAMLKEAVAIETDRRDRLAASSTLHSLGDLALDQHDPDAAAAWSHKALAISFELGDERTEAYCLAGFACIAALRGDGFTAAQLWAVVESVESLRGVRLLAPERSRYESYLASLERTPEFAAGKSAGNAVALNDVVQKLLAG